jgi:multidrug resistance efflux pump
VLKKIAEKSKQDYERLQQLAGERVVSASEVSKAKSEYEINIARLQQAERALEYNRLLVELARQEYDQAVAANKIAPSAVPDSEVRRRKIMMDLAKAKLYELSE